MQQRFAKILTLHPGCAEEHDYPHFNIHKIQHFKIKNNHILQYPVYVITKANGWRNKFIQKKNPPPA